MTTMKSTVGWVGFGAMGAPMARRLAQAGHTLHAVPRSDRQRALLRELGAVTHDQLSDVGSASDVIVSIVSGPDEVREVWTGANGLLAGMSGSTVGVEMSTVGVDVVREVNDIARQRGVEIVDAPVSGGVRAAAAGTLAIFAGGSAGALGALAPLATELGTVFPTGPVGSGQVMKLVNQALVGANTFGLCLGWALAARNGLDRKAVLEALLAGAADSRLLRLEWPMLLDMDHMSGFAASHMAKDLRLLRDFCRSSGLDTEVVDNLVTAFATLADTSPPLTATQALGDRMASALPDDQQS